MSAAHDFVVGTSPQIDPRACADRRIGYDRVWRVGVVMLSHAHESNGNVMFMSRGYLARLTQMNEREVRDAVAVLEQSGVLARQRFIVTPLGTQNPSVEWLPGWSPSGKKLKVDFAAVEVDAAQCKEHGVGRDRAWRIAYLARVTKNATAEALARLSGIAVRQVRKALNAVGAKVARVAEAVIEWVLRPDPRHDIRTTNNNTPSQPPTGVVRERARAREGTRRGKNWLRWITGGKIMPWDIFANDDRVPDDDLVPASQLSERARKLIKPSSLPRHERPLETWSPMDSAREFRDQFQKRYPMAPGATGDVVQIAKILGSMRKKYEHDARTEMIVLKRWLDDTNDVIRRNPSVDAWRKWLQAFGRHYHEAEKGVARIDKTYVDYEGRHNRRVRPKQEATRRAVFEQNRKKHKALGDRMRGNN